MFRWIWHSFVASSLLVVATRDHAEQSQTRLLAETWGRALDASTATPVTRVVNLLKEIAATLQKDMEEDEKLYDKLACWCRKNSEAKKTAIKTNSEKISSLEATIEELTASSAELKGKIKELNGEVSDNKQTLAKATALREKELAEFNENEKDSVANIAALKNAITVLSKHHDAALAETSATYSFLSVRSDTSSDDPWGLESKDQRDLDMFMNNNGFDGSTDDDDAVPVQKPPSDSRSFRHSPKVQTGQFVQERSAEEEVAIQTATRLATAFARKQGKDASSYIPGYAAQSGEILGMLKQLNEDMEKDLSEAQKVESTRAGTFAELREAKTAEIEGGQKSVESKEGEKSRADYDLAQAKEDLAETKTTLEEDLKFAAHLKKTCTDADENFEKRRTSRQDEMKAVGEAIEILTADDAKDAMSGTFSNTSFLQISSENHADLRHRAAKLLHRAAAHTGNSDLALLASSTELDAFTNVKAAIDKMLETLTMQQADEVKKNDYCTKELQSNEMATAKAKDKESELEASVKERQMTIDKLQDEINTAKDDITKEQVSLQTATVNRKKENLDFQKTVADQMLTVAVLEKAMNRLATFYDEQSFIQTRHSHQRQKPPVQQMEYKPSEASGGVLSMIEKLIYDAKEIMAESKKNEADAQDAYEVMVKDSNGTIKALMKTILSKTDAQAEAKKDHHEDSRDLKATQKELVKLAKYDADLHEDCDYVMKNFNVRQTARSEEMESLRAAKGVLNGATV